MKGELITLAEAKGMLLVDHGDMDARISLLIGSATTRLLRYLKTDGQEFADSNEEIVSGLVPDDIKHAAAMLIKISLDLSPEEQEKLFRENTMPIQVTSIIGDRRMPTLA